MNVAKKSLVVLSSVFVLSSASFADVGIATVSDFSGKVLVNAGEGFVPAAVDMQLKAGDRILVGEKSTASLAYENCAVVLDKPAVVLVQGEGACAAPGGTTLVQPVADVYVPDAGMPAAAGLLGGIPPVVLLTTVGITAVTCAVACGKVFGDDNNGVSGN